MLLKKAVVAPKSGTLAPRISIHLLTLCMIVLGFVAWNVWSGYWDFRTARAKNSRLDEMVRQITQLDQFMTTFARLDATFGDTRWEDHYWESALQREKVMKQMRKLSPKVFASEDALEMNTTRVTITNQETQALEYVRKNTPELADRMVFGDAYEKQKGTYAESFKKVTEDLRNNLAYHFHSRQQKALTSVILGAVLLPIFILAHFILLISINRFYAKRDRPLQKA